MSASYQPREVLTDAPLSAPSSRTASTDPSGVTKAGITAAEIELLKREKAGQNLPSLSAVMEKAVRDLLAQSDPGRDGLRVPAAQGRLHNRVYMLSPNTIGVLNDLAREYRFRIQDILRASLDRLGRKDVPGYDDKS